MDRATGFEPVGWGFDSLRARQPSLAGVITTRASAGRPSEPVEVRPGSTERRRAHQIFQPTLELRRDGLASARQDRRRRHLPRAGHDDGRSLRAIACGVELVASWMHSGLPTTRRPITVNPSRSGPARIIHKRFALTPGNRLCRISDLFSTAIRTAIEPLDDNTFRIGEHASTPRSVSRPRSGRFSRRNHDNVTMTRPRKGTKRRQKRKARQDYALDS